MKLGMLIGMDRGRVKTGLDFWIYVNSAVK